MGPVCAEVTGSTPVGDMRIMSNGRISLKSPSGLDLRGSVVIYNQSKSRHSVTYPHRNRGILVFSTDYGKTIYYVRLQELLNRTDLWA